LHSRPIDFLPFFEMKSWIHETLLASKVKRRSLVQNITLGTSRRSSSCSWTHQWPQYCRFTWFGLCFKRDPCCTSSSFSNQAKTGASAEKVRDVLNNFSNLFTYKGNYNGFFLNSTSWNCTFMLYNLIIHLFFWRLNFKY